MTATYTSACGLGVLLAVAVSAAGAGNITRGVDPDTGLAKWRLSAGDAEFELIQRLPDQTRGFFEARHFPSDAAEAIAQNCIFQTIIRNTGSPGKGGAVAIDLGTWRVVHGGTEGRLALKENWLAGWSEADVSSDAKLAFQWAMFPDRQEFLPGDYNWGMTAYGLPPGSRFDLHLIWQAGGGEQSDWIRDIECAPDVEKLK